MAHKLQKPFHYWWPTHVMYHRDQEHKEAATECHGNEELLTPLTWLRACLACSKRQLEMLVQSSTEAKCKQARNGKQSWLTFSANCVACQRARCQRGKRSIAIVKLPIIRTSPLALPLSEALGLDWCKVACDGQSCKCHMLSCYIWSHCKSTVWLSSSLLPVQTSDHVSRNLTFRELHKPERVL